MTAAARPRAARGALSTLSARWKLRHCEQVGADPRVRGRVVIHGGGTVRMGARVVLDGSLAPIEFHVSRGARIVLGDDVTVEAGTSIEARRSVLIGSRVRLGAFTKILDNHFHAVRGDRHRRPDSQEIVVEDDVEVEARSILLPGAILHRGALVSSGSVVSRTVPAGAVVTGVPANVRPRRPPP